MPTLSEFMARVVAWPADSTAGYVNLHWKTLNPKYLGKEFWSGKPTQTVRGFVELVHWATGRPLIKDIYFCLSTQNAVGKDGHGRSKVLRLQANATFLKAIWLDIDIKEAPHGYATITEALDALEAFLETNKIPAPTALVKSGGGLHVYWISDKPLTVADWRPYAEGLKTLALQFGLRCDAGVTTDCARVLRVPETSNFKTKPPKPVRILGNLRPDDYVFERDLSALAQVAPTGTGAVSVHAGARAVLYKLDETKFPKRPIPPGGIESLADGLFDRAQDRKSPEETRAILQGCPFLGNALRTGGKDYKQPMWNLTTLAATWLEEGHAFAHAFGDKHPEYSVESTDALWDRKNKERETRHLGWPSCSAIQAAGSTVCAGCPHLAKGKSPLNLATPTVTNLPVPLATGATVQKSDILLPAGYAMDPHGLISKIVEEPITGGPPITKLVPIFHCRIMAPWHQLGPEALNFTVSTDKGNLKAVSVPMKDMATASDLMRYMLSHSITPCVKHATTVQEFAVSWISKLRDAQKATSSLPFGWLIENGKRRGFVYGGVIMRDDGTDSPSGYGDPEIRKQYSPTGQLTPWLDALKVILDQKRPELECIVATAFAAPLMICPGEYNMLLSVYGDTGAGKSSAMQVATSVWGHPKTAKEVTMTTARSAVGKLGELRNLPLYWDEIKNKKTQIKVFDTIFGTEGVGPGRMTSDTSQRAKTDWQTMMCICANLSFIDCVAKELRQSAAGMQRVMEYKIKKVPPTALGQLQSYDATRIMQHLEYNYGVMGLKYSKMLASDPVAIDGYVMKVVDSFARELGTVQEERFWAAGSGVILAGAGLANELLKASGFAGQFDLVTMRKLLKDTVIHMRTRIIDENVEGGTVDNTESTLTAFLKAFTAETVYTDTYPMGQGKPKLVTVLEPAPSLQHPKPIQVHWVVNDRLLRIGREAFTKWMGENNMSAADVMDGLKTHFKMTATKSRLAAGTLYPCGRELIMTIPVPSGSPLEEQLFAHGGMPEGWVPGAPPAKAPRFDSVNPPLSELAQRAADQAAKDLELVRNKT